MNNFNLPPIADTAAHHAELLSGVNNLLATAAFHDVKAADLNMDYVYSEELGDIKIPASQNGELRPQDYQPDIPDEIYGEVPDLPNDQDTYKFPW